MNTTESAKRIEMTYLRKSGYLCGWSWRTISWTRGGESDGHITARINTETDNGEGNYMDLDYKVRSHGSDEWKPINYRVKMQCTPCRYGGKRWWFICPNVRCERRNSILYQCGDYFVCRKCAGLKYDSQSYSGKYSLLRNLFASEDYERSVKRWYYRGKPTRKHRRFLKMTKGMSENDRLEACLSMLRAK